MREVVRMTKLPFFSLWKGTLVPPAGKDLLGLGRSSKIAIPHSCCVATGNSN